MASDYIDTVRARLALNSSDQEALFVATLRDWANARISDLELIFRLEPVFRPHHTFMQGLNELLPPSRFRVQCAPPTLDHDGDVTLFTILMPEQSLIHHAREIPPPYIHDTVTLRTYLQGLTTTDHDALLKLDKDWLFCIMQLLQAELDSPLSVDATYRRKCMYCLLAVASKIDKLPPSYVSVQQWTTSDINGQDILESSSTIRTAEWRGRVICCKVLTDGHPARTEALIWRQLQHPNILPFLGISYGFGPNKIVLFSPWAGRGTIMNFLVANPGHDRMKFVLQIAEGMRYLHEYSPSIFHGDIKGSNILLTDALVPVLADFGLSSVAETRSQTTNVPSGGTLMYMAPELLGPNEFPGSFDPVRMKSDVYAFGCTVYEMFVGVPPWGGKESSLVRTNTLAGIRPLRPHFATPPSGNAAGWSMEFTAEAWGCYEACTRFKADDRPTSHTIVTLLSMGLGLNPANKPMSRVLQVEDLSVVAALRPHFFQTSHHHPLDPNAERERVEADRAIIWNKVLATLDRPPSSQKKALPRLPTNNYETPSSLPVQGERFPNTKKLGRMRRMFSSPDLRGRTDTGVTDSKETPGVREDGENHGPSTLRRRRNATMLTPLLEEEGGAGSSSHNEGLQELQRPKGKQEKGSSPSFPFSFKNLFLSSKHDKAKDKADRRNARNETKSQHRHSVSFDLLGHPTTEERPAKKQNVHRKLAPARSLRGGPPREAPSSTQRNAAKSNIKKTTFEAAQTPPQTTQYDAPPPPYTYNPPPRAPATTYYRRTNHNDLTGLFCLIFCYFVLFIFALYFSVMYVRWKIGQTLGVCPSGVLAQAQALKVKTTTQEAIPLNSLVPLSFAVRVVQRLFCPYG